MERSEKEQCQQLHGHFGVMAKFVTTGTGFPEVMETIPLRKRSCAREVRRKGIRIDFIFNFSELTFLGYIVHGQFLLDG